MDSQSKWTYFVRAAKVSNISTHTIIAVSQARVTIVLTAQVGSGLSVMVLSFLGFP